LSFEQPISSLGITGEKNCALADAQHFIRERGAPVIIRLQTESNVTRDRYGSIKKRTSPGDLTFYAFPIIYSPTVKQLEEAGIREITDVLIKTAVMDWNDAGYTMDTLRVIDSIRATVIINNSKYEIKSKQLDSQYSDTFLYIHLGLNRI